MTVYPTAENRLWPWGILLLRVVVGLTFFMHGQQKLFGEGGVGGVGGFFGSLGVPAPGFFALVVSVLETVGGLALILGILTRVVGVLLAIDVIVAMLLVHAPNGFFAQNGGIELVLVLAAAALALALTGPGALAFDHAMPWERRLAGRQALATSRS
jgi:putative oxidoreductase